MNKDMMSIPERLGNLMVSQNVTQAELVRRTGLPVSTISRYVTGRRKIPVENLRLIADALGVKLAYLTGEEGREPGWVDPDIQYFYTQIFPDLCPEFKSLLRHSMDVLRVHSERCTVSCTS